MELLWARIKGEYGRAYNAVKVGDFLENFCGGLAETDLLGVARRCDEVAAGLAGEEPLLLLDDDLAPEPGGDDLADEDESPAEQDLGEMPEL